eukprot:COSAG05_NODE_22397_length_265_cov_0.620482_1_plen_83_part_10
MLHLSIVMLKSTIKSVIPSGVDIIAPGRARGVPEVMEAVQYDVDGVASECEAALVASDERDSGTGGVLGQAHSYVRVVVCRGP